ncbi:MAG TPA: sugar kinase [Candidatus Stackebrandtia excrementipullorum]|nr:sugar kinase [Candidatus Stackebrandtia excrementipullorum]
MTNSPADFDVVCLGEAMALLAPEPIRPLTDGTALTLTVAGAECNVAVNMAQLGARVAWCGRVGADPFGAMIVDRLSDAGVDVGCIQVDTTLPTGLYFKDPHGGTVYYYRNGSAASAMGTDFVDGMPPAHVVHVSGITAALSPTCSAAVHDLIVNRPHHGLLSFDVNYRDKLWPVEFAAPVLRRLANACDVVFVGRDEAHKLWGTVTADDVRDRLDTVGTLVVKDAAVGATLYTGDTAVFVATPPVEVVEPVGAGDAFAAGFLYALRHNADGATSLRLGHLLAAGTMAVTGDIAPPPSVEHVNRVLDGF